MAAEQNSEQSTKEVGPLLIDSNNGILNHNSDVTSEELAFMRSLFKAYGMFQLDMSLLDWLQDIRSEFERQPPNFKRMRACILKFTKLRFPEEGRKPIYTMLFINCQYGNNLTKIISRANTNSVGKLRALKEAYCIKDKDEGKNSTLTLSKVALCFPELAVKMMAHHQIKGIVHDVLESYPFAMRHPAFAAFIPKNITGEDAAFVSQVRKAFIYYQTNLFGELKRTLSDPNKSMIDKQERYINMIIQQSWWSDAQRLEFIHETVENNNPAVIEYSLKYERILELANLFDF